MIAAEMPKKRNIHVEVFIVLAFRNLNRLKRIIFKYFEC